MSLMFFIFLPPSASSVAKKVHRYKKDGKEYKDPVLSYPFHLIMIASKDPRLFLQLSYIRYNHGNIFFFDPFDPGHISKSPVMCPHPSLCSYVKGDIRVMTRVVYLVNQRRPLISTSAFSAMTLCAVFIKDNFAT